MKISIKTLRNIVETLKILLVIAAIERPGWTVVVIFIFLLAVQLTKHFPRLG